MATKRDYYDVLGVPKSATADEIKRAYRKVAHQHHPDKDGGDEAKFKEASEAYEVLGDQQKRSSYDQYGHAGTGGNPFAGGAQSSGSGFGGFDYSGGGFDFSDILNDFMGGFSGTHKQAPQRGRDLEVSLTVDFIDAVFGTERTVTLDLDDVCSICRGNGAAKGSSLKTCSTCGGRGQVTKMQQTILGAIQQTATCSICHGRGEVPETPCVTCHGSGIERRRRDISVKIPAGIDNGATMRLSGQGAAARGTGTKGDLYLRFRVKADKRFQRDGADIHTELKLSMVEASLGGEAKVETVDGPLKIKIPAGTQSGKVIRLSERGVPRLQARGRGDHLVHVIVETPTKITPRQRQLLEEFAATSPESKKGFWKL